MVVSTASWAPRKRGRPSATTSRRRASWRATRRSRSRRNTLVQTRVPTSRQIRAAAFSNENPLTPKHPRPRARCTVVAKEVKKTGTPGGARGQRQGSHKRRRTSTRKRWGQKRNVGEEGTDVNGSPDMGPECDLKRACSVGGQPWPDGAGRETFFHCPCCAELPTVVERARVKLPKARWARGGDHQPEPANRVCRTQHRSTPVDSQQHHEGGQRPLEGQCEQHHSVVL